MRLDRLVLRASIAVVAAVGIGLGVDWLVSRRAQTLVYVPAGPVDRVEVVLPAGGVEIVGEREGAVRVERIERSSFGHPPVERRSLAGGVLRLSAACPRILLGGCSAAYRVTAPDDVSIAVRTGSGGVRLDGFSGRAQIQSSSGDVTVAAFCGTSLTATTGSGNIEVVAACAPESLDLRTASGDATALVPRGRYRITARSGSGEQRIRNVTASPASLFAIGVQSRTGDVTVAGGL